MEFVSTGEMSKKGEFPKNIILIGLPGSGKTLVAKALSLKLGFGFLDLDGAIEKLKKKNINEIFAQEGLEGFREIESQILSSLSPICNHILAVGGGALEKQENFEILQSIGLLVWIDTSIEEISHRLLRDRVGLKRRPLLSEVEDMGESERKIELKKRLEFLLAQRSGQYKKAPIVLRDDASSPEVCAKKLCSSIRDYANHEG